MAVEASVPSDRDMAEAHFANLRDHQIGQEGGIPPDVAEDIGFKSPDASNVTAEQVTDEAANLAKQFVGPEAEARAQLIEGKLDEGKPITQEEVLFLSGKASFERGGEPPIDVK